MILSDKELRKIKALLSGPMNSKVLEDIYNILGDRYYGLAMAETPMGEFSVFRTHIAQWADGQKIHVWPLEPLSYSIAGRGATEVYYASGEFTWEGRGIPTTYYRFCK